MATMLAVLTTDAVATPEPLLDGAARRGGRLASTRLRTDGCTSTNDTVLLLASGRGRPASTGPSWPTAVAEACADLAAQMAGDAEGATKVVTLP